MLTIIINHDNNSTNSIKKYISFLNNIIQKYVIELIIINCNEEINNIIIENINPNLSISIYNYSSNFNDSIYNDILNFVTYDKILFTNYNSFFTNILFDWINNNDINENTYIKTNIFTLKSLSEQFFSNFSNSIYNHISENILTISNELGIFNIDSNTFIDIFNNNKQIHIIDSENIINNNTLFIHNTNDFLLINKNTLKNIGFNINNSNYNHSLQYLTLSLIKNNLQMIKLPYLISVFKQFDKDESKETFININSEYITSIDYNKFINYKIYNLNTKKTTSYIRNQIKTIKGYNTASTVEENESLKKKIKELNYILDNNKINSSISNNQQVEDLIQHNKDLKQQNEYLEQQKQHLAQQSEDLKQQNTELLNNIQNLKNNILLKLYDIINFDLDK